jgi:tetratricopeptide (TPR) repeat protein
MTKSLVEGLPKSVRGSLASRLFQAYFALFLSSIGAVALALRLGSGIAALATFFTMFVLHFAVIITSVILQGRAVRALAGAEAMVTTDPVAAHAAAATALRTGLSGDRYMRAWLLVARIAEENGALQDAEEALRRALRFHGGTRTRNSPETIRAVHMRLAFVYAATGRLDEAEKELATCTSFELSNDAVRAEYTRAKALSLYKRGRFRQVVDLATSARISLERDRRFLDALARSSLLRLEAGAAPMRIAEEPQHDEWIERVVPELRARRQ